MKYILSKFMFKIFHDSTKMIVFPKNQCIGYKILILDYTLLFKSCFIHQDLQFEPYIKALLQF